MLFFFVLFCFLARGGGGCKENKKLVTGMRPVVFFLYYIILQLKFAIVKALFKYLKIHMIDYYFFEFISFCAIPFFFLLFYSSLCRQEGFFPAKK